MPLSVVEHVEFLGAVCHLCEKNVRKRNTMVTSSRSQSSVYATHLSGTYTTLTASHVCDDIILYPVVCSAIEA